MIPHAKSAKAAKAKTRFPNVRIPPFANFATFA
jgi:hypothetical protein